MWPPFGSDLFIAVIEEVNVNRDSCAVRKSGSGS